MTKYEADRQDAYDSILEDGAMGTASKGARKAYDPATSRADAQAPVQSAVPMIEIPVDRNTRYGEGTLITEGDVKLLVAALDDQGTPFDLAMEHHLEFQGVGYVPKSIDRIAPDGAPIMFEAIVSKP